MRRFFLFLILLVLLGGVGLVAYSYVAELPPPTEAMETPAVGVGFAD